MAHTPIMLLLEFAFALLPETTYLTFLIGIDWWWLFTLGDKYGFNLLLPWDLCVRGLIAGGKATKL